MEANEKRTFSLNEYGYINKWLVSGPVNERVDQSARTISDQWTYEQHLRKTAHDEGPTAMPTDISFGKPGLDGMPWRYYQAGVNSFLDASGFYSTVHTCELWAATVLCSETEQDVEADLYSYVASAIWLNGERVFCRTESNYAPVFHARITLHLHEGENLLFVRMHNICARDARNVFGISFRDPSAVRVAYPGEQSEELMQAEDAAQWLSQVRYDGKDSLIAPVNPPIPVSVEVSLKNGEQEMKASWDADAFFVMDEDVIAVRVSAQAGETELLRKIERNDRMLPQSAASLPIQQERERILQMLVDAPYKNGTSEMHKLYAKLALGGTFDEADARAVRHACETIDENHDCSDFRLSALLKMLKCGMPLPEEMRELIHRTAVGFCYWTDETTCGAMATGTENHSLMFHGCQMMAGSLWPDEVFPRSGRTGREQQAIARERICVWLDKVEKNGFKEYLSGTYMPVTTGAMLAVVDHADEQISARMAKLLDKLFYDFATNAYDDIVVAPQGRIYRDILNPWEHGTQGLYHFATGRGPVLMSEWFGVFAKTKYRIPDDVCEYATRRGLTTYRTSGTEIYTYKSEGFILTSTPVPRAESDGHGLYEPGAYGMQQHLFYASLGGAANVFISHPSATFDGTIIRPGYWNGNSYLPALEQRDNALALAYCMDDALAVKFTHMYLPTFAFDEIRDEDGWKFCRRGEAYLAVWCSKKLHLYDADIVQGCDFRAEEGSCGWLLVCGDKTIVPDFDAFCAYAKAFAPQFDEQSGTLRSRDWTVRNDMHAKGVQTPF